ncbi:MAG: hypothetical protein ACO36E_09100 [Synechocystis sp.]
MNNLSADRHFFGLRWRSALCFRCDYHNPNVFFSALLTSAIGQEPITR